MINYRSPKKLTTLLSFFIVVLFIESTLACSIEDLNGDTLILSTGQATVSGNSSIVLNGITYNNTVHNNIELNLDPNTSGWSITPPFPPAVEFDLSNAEVTLISDNHIRLSGLIYFGVSYNATVILNLDGTFLVQDVSPWIGGVDVSNTSNFGSWIGSGGQDETSEGNPRYTLELCTAQSIAVDLTSNTDSYLYLLDTNGNIIAENNDSDFNSDNFNARIEITLPAGDYTVVVATHSPGEIDTFDIKINTDDGGGALNLKAIPGTSFVDYASVGGRVTDVQTGESIAAAEILVFDLLSGFSDVTVFSNSNGYYFLRTFADRLRANTFNATAIADGCEQSAALFGIVNEDNHATINFGLDCTTQNNSDVLSVELTSGICSITKLNTSFASYEFALEASGTASGSVDTRFDFEWTENPGINIENCGNWTFRQSQQDCIRGPNDPHTTTWSGGSSVNLSQSAVNFNQPRQITPFVNRGGSLGSTHPANLELEPFVIACQ